MAKAAIDEIPLSAVPYNVQLDPDENAVNKYKMWLLYDAFKNKSYKGRIGPIPYSIKIKKIYPLLVWWLGEPPFPVQ